MMRSLYTGVSGLESHQTKMDVIANNISNVNTLAYKADRVNFSEMLNQTLRNASGTVEGSVRGSRNPMQIGLGTVVASIDKTMSPGSGQRTDDPMDVMIEGNGFFIVGDEKGQYFTRAGNFNFDHKSGLNMNGYQVYGWSAVYNDTTKEYEIQQAAVAPLVFSDMELMPGEPTTRSDFSGNLNASVDGQDGIETTMTVYDAEGNRYDVPLIFRYDSENSTGEMSAWSYEIKTDASGRHMIYPDGDDSNPVKMNFSATQGDTTSWHPLGWLGFDTNGRLATFGTGQNTLNPPTNAEDGKIQLELFMNSPDPDRPAFGSGGTGSVVLDFTNLTQFGNETSHVAAVAADGYPEGTLNDINIENDGKITGSYTNSRSRLLGQISLANIQNPSGMERHGDNLFTTTVNSGEFNGVGTVGTLISGVLEMSNVDLSLQFTQMITTQRGFQTNSRIITTSNEMLQEAIGLKR